MHQHRPSALQELVKCAVAVGILQPRMLRAVEQHWLPSLAKPTLVEGLEDAVHGAMVEQAGTQPREGGNHVALQMLVAEIAPGGDQDLMRDKALDILALQQLI